MFIIQIKQNMSCFSSPSPQQLSMPGPLPPKAGPSAAPDEDDAGSLPPKVGRRRAAAQRPFSTAACPPWQRQTLTWEPPTHPPLRGPRLSENILYGIEPPFSLLRASYTLVFLSILFYIPNIRLSKLNVGCVHRRVYNSVVSEKSGLCFK